MITIKLWGRFGIGLNANTDSVLYCLNEMLKAKNGEEIFIDFSEVSFLYPSGIVILITVGKYLAETRKCTIRQSYPQDSEARNFLVESGFCEITGIPSVVDITIPSHNGSYIYKVKNFRYVDDFEIEKLIDVIEKELQLSGQIRNYVHENLAELILNVQQHSNSAIGCYVMGQGYKSSHKVRFCIGDAGIGVRKHLGNKYTDLLSKNSVYAIEMALIEGVTGTRDNQNSGIGLTNLRKFVNFCGGMFTVLSGDGMYMEEAKSEGVNRIKKELDFEMPGVYIDVAIDSHPGKKIFSKSEPIPPGYRLIK